jgi:hypothetical protein
LEFRLASENENVSVEIEPLTEPELVALLEDPNLGVELTRALNLWKKAHNLESAGKEALLGAMKSAILQAPSRLQPGTAEEAGDWLTAKCKAINFMTENIPWPRRVIVHLPLPGLVKVPLTFIDTRGLDPSEDGPEGPNQGDSATELGRAVYGDPSLLFVLCGRFGPVPDGSLQALVNPKNIAWQSNCTMLQRAMLLLLARDTDDFETVLGEDAEFLPRQQAIEQYGSRQKNILHLNSNAPVAATSARSGDRRRAPRKNGW